MTNDPNVLSALYALAGLIGGVFNAKVSGKPFRCPEGMTAVITGAIIGGVWYVWPLIDFDATTPVVARMFVIGAIAFFGADLIRNQVIKRLGLIADRDPAPAGKNGPAGPPPTEPPKPVS